jgi:hypothetical protein
MANQVDFKILPSDQFSVYSPSTRSDKIITYFTLLSKLRGDILTVSSEEDPNNITSAYYTNSGGVQTLHLVKADGSEVTASQPQQIISGTVNYVSKFTTANDIGDSQIFDNGTNVGIGTTTMTHKLQLGTGGVFADYFQLDTTYSNGFVVGALSWDIDNGTADIGLSGSLKLKIGQDDVWYVKNSTGSAINKGTAVYASGTLGASSKILITPMIADGSIPARFFLGIVAETIANGAEGYVLTKGKLRNINTNAYNEGDVLWVSPTVAGALTATEPTAPYLKLPVAFVVSKGNNGVLAVRATTGQRIADASDVDYTGAADNSFLVYNSSTGVWEDEAIGIFKTIAVSGQSNVVADSYIDTLTLVAGTNVTITTDATTDSITINSTDQYVGTVTSVATTAPITGGTITTTGTIGITQSGAASDGYLSFTDWNTFNGKEPALTKGNLTETTSSVLTITGGTNAVIGTGTSIAVSQAGASSSGYLSSTDWNTFNSKSGAAFKTISVAGQSDIIADAADDTLTITAGTGVTLTTNSTTDTLTITNAAPDQTVVLTAGIGITTSGTYPNFTITNSAPDQIVSLTGAGTTVVTGAYPSFTITSNDQYVGTVTSVNLTAGTGISVSGGPITSSGSITVTNTDTGSAQNIFKTIAVSGQTDIVADSNNDTLTVAAGTGVTITTNATTDTLTISATGSGGTVTSIATTAPITGGPITGTGTIAITQSSSTTDGYLSSTDWSTFNGKTGLAFKTISVTGQTDIVADAAEDTLNVAAGTGISLTTTALSDTLTITNSAPDQTVVLTGGTGITTSGTYPNFTITNNDLGSSQDIFKTIAVSGQTNIVADSNNDTLTFAAGTGISITTNATTDTVTITNTGNPIPCFSAYSSTGVALTTDGALYDFGLDTETIKDSSVFTHSTSTDPDEITVLATGTYEISYSAAMINANATTNDAAVVNVYIYKNGSSLVTALNTVQNVAHLNTSNYNYYNQIANSYIVSLTANDVIKLVALPSYLGGAGSSYGVVFGYLGNNNVTIKKLG